MPELTGLQAPAIEAATQVSLSRVVASKDLCLRSCITQFNEAHFRLCGSPISAFPVRHSSLVLKCSLLLKLQGLFLRGPLAD